VTHESWKPAAVSLSMLRSVRVHLSLKSPARMTALPAELAATAARIWSMPAERAFASPFVDLEVGEKQ
jgi:hypothetical protein